MRLFSKIVSIIGCLVIVNLTAFGLWFYSLSSSYMGRTASYRQSIGEFDAERRRMEKKTSPFYIGGLILLNAFVLPKLIRAFFDKENP